MAEMQETPVGGAEGGPPPATGDAPVAAAAEASVEGPADEPTAPARAAAGEEATQVLENRGTEEAPDAGRRRAEEPGEAPAPKRGRYTGEPIASHGEQVPAHLVAAVQREIPVDKLEWDLARTQGQIRALNVEILQARKAAVRVNPQRSRCG